MNAITARISEALSILTLVWGSSRNQPSLTAMKWFYSAPAAEAFIDFALRLAATPERASTIREIFTLRCEIAARKAGWCPELDVAGDDADY